MSVQKEMFEKRLGQHRKLASYINGIEDFSKLSDGLKARYVKQGSELVLVWAGFKCENKDCKKETDLTFHHLVGRRNSGFVDERKYFVQRHYFYNIAILCSDCHKKTHGFIQQLQMGVISDKKISEAKRRFKLG